MSFTVDDVVLFNKKAAADPQERWRWVEWANSYLRFTENDRGKAAAYANGKIAKERRAGRRPNPDEDVAYAKFRRGGPRRARVSENPLSPGPGWEELENVESTIADRRLDLDALWRAVGQGDNKEALLLLDEGWETDGLAEVWIVAVPDDFLGDHYRIWVR